MLFRSSPTGSETGNRNFKLLQQLANWTDKDGSGIGFDSSTGFKLPNGAERSPDAAWMTLEKWQTISLEKRRQFAPLCPDFVVEIRSPSDQLQSLQDKLQEYINNGANILPMPPNLPNTPDIVDKSKPPAA